MLNSIVVAPVAIVPVTITWSWVFDVSIFVVYAQAIELILVTATQVGEPAAKIETGDGLLGFHFGNTITIFPSGEIEFVKVNENFRFSVAPTVYVAEVKVTANAPGVAVTVNEPLEVSIVAPADVKVVIEIDDVVFENRGLVIESTEKDIVYEVVAAANVIVRILVDLFRLQLVIPVVGIPVNGVHVFVAVVVDWLEKS